MVVVIFNDVAIAGPTERLTYTEGAVNLGGPRNGARLSSPASRGGRWSTAERAVHGGPGAARRPDSEGEGGLFQERSAQAVFRAGRGGAAAGGIESSGTPRS